MKLRDKLVILFVVLAGGLVQLLAWMIGGLVRDRRSVAGWYAGLLQGHCLRHGIGPDEAERLVVDNWGDCKAVLDGRMTVSELLNCQHGTPMISPCERCAELERLTGKGAA